MHSSVWHTWTSFWASYSSLSLIFTGFCNIEFVMFPSLLNLQSKQFTLRFSGILRKLHPVTLEFLFVLLLETRLQFFLTLYENPVKAIFVFTVFNLEIKTKFSLLEISENTRETMKIFFNICLSCVIANTVFICCSCCCGVVWESFYFLMSFVKEGTYSKLFSGNLFSVWYTQVIFSIFIYSFITGCVTTW